MIEAIVSGVVAGVILLWIEHKTGWVRNRAAPADTPRRDRQPQPTPRVAKLSNRILRGADVAQAVDAVAFDDDKLKVVESMLAGLRARSLTGDELEAILRSFTFDSGKVSALRMLSTKVRRPVSGSTRVRVLGLIQSSTEQASAAEIMGE